MRLLLAGLLFFTFHLEARICTVGVRMNYLKIRDALAAAQHYDTIYVHAGVYREGTIKINKPVSLFGVNHPVIDGDRKFEVITIDTGNVILRGFVIQHSGYATLDDPGGVKVRDSRNVVVEQNILRENFFGIYIQNCSNCIVRNNTISATGKEEQTIGNGIHCWKSDTLQITGNTITGHRDGIYFEFVTNSVIWRNVSYSNIRYGLHFMFSNNDAYFTNIFSGNGAGVAVMFTKNVTMMNNSFLNNWGDAAYGLLLKEISDSNISGNNFDGNTSGIYMEGTSRILIEKNHFSNNGWGMRIQASCMDNVMQNNVFSNNTFDVSTNGSLVLNIFKRNYWDKYDGYDLNRDNIGDVPFHPLSLFSVIAESSPSAMLLYRSFIVTVLDQTERILPSITPDEFVDLEPLMKPTLK